MTRGDGQGPSWGVTALLAIHFEKQPDTWFEVPALAAHFQLTAAYVLFNLEAMAGLGQVEAQRDAGGTIERVRLLPQKAQACA